MVLMNDEHGSPIGCVFSSKDGAKIILGACTADTDLAEAQTALEEDFVEINAESEVQILDAPESSAVNELLIEAYEMSTLREFNLDALPPGRFHMFELRVVGDFSFAILGWRNLRGDFYLSVIYSIDQIRILLRGLDFVTDDERKLVIGTLKRIGFASKSRRLRLLAKSQIFGYMCFAQLLKTSAKAEQKRIEDTLNKDAGPNPLFVASIIIPGISE